ncbi:ABC transporter ATP-binding protein [Cuneatibacter caecimuris]|uniref:ATP-binding cassette subfamily B protein n=1 Tax=Cuneatibacter caecimuris TaxID=1796618 RepID=A0A4Q7PJW7_9FIRM|nr:ABC transporter ATP-binding protein [Cuneatibacter caecimuris]RZT00568.1 ATP-binding cassette subfamily B protein [Cuneatibacter caecimuris]
MKSQSRLKEFCKLYLPCRFRFSLILLCSFAASLFTLLIPLCVSKITNIVIDMDSSEALSKLLPVCGVMLALAVLEMLFNYFYDFYGHKLGAEMENALRQKLFAHLTRLSSSEYDEFRVGQLMSSLTNDLLDLTELFHHGPEDYVTSIVKFIGTGIILVSVCGPLSLIAFLCIPVMALYTLYFSHKVRIISRKNRQDISDINAQAEDLLSGIRVVQAYGQEAQAERRFAAAGKRFFHSRTGIYFIESVEYQGVQFLLQLMTILVVGCCAVLISKGSIPVSVLVAFLMYVGYLTEPIRRIAGMTNQYQQGMAGFERVMHFMEMEPEIRDAADAESFLECRGEIRMEHVSFSYRQETGEVLHDISFTIPAGGYAAVTGESGVGKSTLCRLIPRFYEPDSGNIYIDGKNIRSLKLADLRSQIAYVQQDAYLFDGTIEENIRFGREDAAEEEIRQAARYAMADDFIMALPDGYQSLTGPKGVRLSGGQKQRICLARAFLKNAPILILDEATSALDSRTEAQVIAAMEAQRKGKTTLVIAHRLSTVEHAQQLLHFEDGRITGPDKAYRRN